jgi:hypothetical protein
MKYSELKKAVEVASLESARDGILSYFWRTNGNLELTYPALILPDNNATFNQLCKLADAGLVEFDGADELVIVL